MIIKIWNGNTNRGEFYHDLSIGRQTGNRYIPSPDLLCALTFFPPYLFASLCVPKINEGLIGLERHEGE